MTLSFEHLPATCLILALFTVTEQSRAENLEAIITRGNDYRLQGDFSAADGVRDALLRLYPEDPASSLFNLNSIMTHLSWEDQQTRYDTALKHDTQRLLTWCEPRLEHPTDAARANFLCGHAHFSLSFFNGIRGQYITAGRHGSRSITYFEKALALDPAQIESKMYLGVAYFTADNLPSFIRLMSHLLWFIPTGDSEKSLPYLVDVMRSDSRFSDVARYIYSTLLIDGDDIQQQQAVAALGELTARYPGNHRFRLRLISVLVDRGAYRETVELIETFMASRHSARMNSVNLSLVNIWHARALLGLGRTREAEAAYADVNFSKDVEHPVPDWGISWYLLTGAQLEDLAGNRDQALATYERILALQKTTYVSRDVVVAAEKGISTPFAHEKPPS